MQRDDRRQNYNYSLDTIANKHRTSSKQKAAGFALANAMEIQA
jgi:hypothetical protein